MLLGREPGSLTVPKTYPGLESVFLGKISVGLCFAKSEGTKKKTSGV